MPSQELPEDFRRLLETVKGKRSRIVIQHILEHGYVTTEELESLYGYKHPPRAIRDVREQGIPLETFQTRDTDGKAIAAYRFPNPLPDVYGQLRGRKALSKALKQHLLEQDGARCMICAGSFEPSDLQIDHRTPYEIVGDAGNAADPLDFMLVCRSCNRAKSWSCEHCQNWLLDKNPEVCATCYWASPVDYQHIALIPMRRLDITWSGSEIEIYEELQRAALAAGQSVSEYMKTILELYLRNR